MTITKKRKPLRPKKSLAEMENDRRIGARIKEIRQLQKLDQREFGRRLGVTNPAVAQWEAGTATCTRPYLDLIVKEFKVSRDWLHTGNGSPTLDKTVEQMHLLSRPRVQAVEDFIQHLLNEEAKDKSLGENTRQ